MSDGRAAGVAGHSALGTWIIRTESGPGIEASFMLAKKSRSPAPGKGVAIRSLCRLSSSFGRLVLFLVIRP
jgi:hypothetical protein